MFDATLTPVVEGQNGIVFAVSVFMGITPLLLPDQLGALPVTVATTVFALL